MTRRFATMLAAVALCASSAGAQNFQANPNRDPRRAALEQQFRERGEQLVRERLNLSPEQMARLRDVNGRMDQQRKTLLQQERAARIALRAEVTRGKGADQQRVTQLMSQANSLQQQRFQLQQEEQRQLSAFLTPVQQAQYIALQAQLRQKMREMRQQQEGGESAGVR